MFKKLLCKFILILLIFNIEIISFASNSVLSSVSDEHSNTEDKTPENSNPMGFYYAQFVKAFEIANRLYVTTPDYQKMIDGAIEGFLKSLDPHCEYLKDEDLEDFHNSIKGSFGGIGVEIFFDNESNAIKVISAIDDLPSAKAGIKPGDYIININGDSVSKIGFNKSVKNLRGEPGSKVSIKVLREEANKKMNILSFDLIRSIVKIKPVKAHIEKNENPAIGDIAYIRISTFNEDTGKSLFENFDKITSESKTGIRGIILDLRNNPGGLLPQAQMVSDFFLKSGDVIVSTKSRNDTSNKTEAILKASDTSKKAPNVPMVVLINTGSASASEIVAGCLQDHKRALIVGTPSFGKGSVQTLIPLSDRSEMKLTIARYYTPSGRSIQAEGIAPDIYIGYAKTEYEDPKDTSSRFNETSLANYLKNETSKQDKNSSDKNIDNKKKNNKEKKEDSNKETSNDLKESERKNKIPEYSDLYKSDFQFARAYDIISSLILLKQTNFIPK